jgi:hypothetical protein
LLGRNKVQNKRNKEIKKKRKMAEENLSNFPPRLPQVALITQALQAKQYKPFTLCTEILASR